MNMQGLSSSNSEKDADEAFLKIYGKYDVFGGRPPTRVRRRL